MRRLLTSHLQSGRGRRLLLLRSLSLFNLVPDYIPFRSTVLLLSAFPRRHAQRCASMVILKLKVGMKISPDGMEPRQLSQEGQLVFGSSRKG